MPSGPASERARPSRLWLVFRTVVTASSLVLIPWVVYLAMSLPTRQVADQWNVAWVGFDLALVVMLGWTAWNAWHRRQMVVLSSVVTATLLVCDAWFDIVLDWGTRHLAVSVATAVLAELPLAALLLRVAVRAIHMMQQGHWRDPKRLTEASGMRRLSVRELVRRGQPNDE